MPPDDLDLFPTPDPHYEKKYYFPVRELERSLRFDMKGDDVIVFLHIQKTGGTTFGRHLVQNVRLEVPCDCRPGQKKCTCWKSLINISLTRSQPCSQIFSTLHQTPRRGIWM